MFQCRWRMREILCFNYLNNNKPKSEALPLPPLLFFVNRDGYRHLFDDRNRYVHLFDVMDWHWNGHLLHVMDRNWNRDGHLLYVMHWYLLHVMMMNRMHVIRHMDTDVLVRTEIIRLIFFQTSWLSSFLIY